MIKKLFLPIETLTGLTITELLFVLLMIIFVFLLIRRKKGVRTWWH